MTTKVISQLLINGGFGSFDSEWRVFESFLPNEPDDAIAVYNRGGSQDGRLLETGERIEHLKYEIQVRGINYLDVWRKMNSIVLFLDSLKNITVEVSPGEIYTVFNVSRQSDITTLGLEMHGTRRRQYLAVTVNLSMKQS